MALLTDDEYRALIGTLGKEGFDEYRQLILLGKLGILNTMLHAALHRALPNPNSSRAHDLSIICSSISLGNVVELHGTPLHDHLNLFVAEALVAKLEN